MLLTCCLWPIHLGHSFHISPNLGSPISDSEDLHLTSRENTDTQQINSLVPRNDPSNAAESPRIQLSNNSLAI